MLHLAPRFGVSLLVALLFAPSSSTAHDSEGRDLGDKRSEATWAVIVAGQITWAGEDHGDCIHRATVTSGRCVRKQPHQGESNQYCPEVTPGLPAHCYRIEDRRDR